MPTNIDTFNNLATGFVKPTSRDGGRVGPQEEAVLHRAYGDLTPAQKKEAGTFVEKSGNAELSRVLNQIQLMNSTTNAIYR